MKNILKLCLVGAALTLAACAHEQQTDTRLTSFAKSDLNGDQRLSYGEYQNYLASQAAYGDSNAQRQLSYDQQNREKAILIQFQKLDYNRDTFVTRDELGF